MATGTNTETDSDASDTAMGGEIDSVEAVLQSRVTDAREKAEINRILYGGAFLELKTGIGKASATAKVNRSRNSSLFLALLYFRTVVLTSRLSRLMPSPNKLARHGESKS